ncbi:MAG: FdtA/QdtA family cupin domain-containing protein [Acidobacteriota bacterium]
MPNSPLDDLRWIDLPSIRDDRGVLTAIESGMDIPFEIRRLFYMHHVTADRGGHAHRDTDQVIVALAGSFRLELSDGRRHETYTMDDPTRGLYTPRMLFIRLFELSPDAVCLVLASSHYDIGKSIRSWDEYLEAIGS